MTRPRLKIDLIFDTDVDLDVIYDFLATKQASFKTITGGKGTEYSCYTHHACGHEDDPATGCTEVKSWTNRA